VPERADTRGLLSVTSPNRRLDRECLQWLLATLGMIASVTGVFRFILPFTSFWLGSRGRSLLMAGVGSAVGVTFRMVARTITAVEPSARWRIHISSGNVLHGRPAAITTDPRRSFRPGDVSTATAASGRTSTRSRAFWPACYGTLSPSMTLIRVPLGASSTTSRPSRSKSHMFEIASSVC
jgi:hypothetical protein